MTRLTTRLVLSHLAVVLIAVVVTFVVVRQLAPTMFANQMHGMGQGSMNGAGQGSLRREFVAAVDQSLMIGAVVGAIAAAFVGVFAAVRLVRPIEALRASARAMAAGQYRAPVPHPAERELADLARDLACLGQTLAQTETRRVALLGEVAHEMRTPLTVIDGYVEGMIDGVLPTTAAELSQVSAEVRRLRRLAEDLSSLSRADEGRLRTVRVDVDLRRVVQEATERLRAQVEERGVRLEIVADADPVFVSADPERIAQVVTNLVGNALRATPAAGVITARTGRQGGRVLVEVADTGEGLNAEDLDRIFERFYRVPGRQTVAGESGHGIGLTISRAIATAHGGDLVAASAGPGSGARFTLALPGLTSNGSKGPKIPQ